MKKFFKIVGVVLGALIVLIIIIGIVSKPRNKIADKQNDQVAASQSASQKSDNTTSTSTTAAGSSSTNSLSASDKTKIATMLTASTNHYTDLLQQGEKILGNVQYADANAGLAAMNDPGSPANKFSKFKQQHGMGQDSSDYIDKVYGQASDLFNQNNAPTDSLDKWSDDINAVQSDFSTWVQVATDWQIRQKTSLELTAASQKMRDDIAKTKADIDAILQKSKS